MLLPQIGEAPLHPFLQEGQGQRLGLGGFDAALAHPLGQPGLAMGAGVPLVHAGEDRVTLVDGDHRAFGQHVELAVGDDGGHFDDVVLVGIQTGHFQVDPDQVLGIQHDGAPWVGAAQSSGPTVRIKYSAS